MNLSAGFVKSQPHLAVKSTARLDADKYAMVFDDGDQEAGAATAATDGKHQRSRSPPRHRSREERSDKVHEDRARDRGRDNDRDYHNRSRDKERERDKGKERDKDSDRGRGEGLNNHHLRSEFCQNEKI